VARWPARLSQQLALDIALPILAVLLVLALAAYALLRLSLRSVTSSLQALATETQRIAAGDLRAPLSVKGADEVGRLGSAFETMRRAVLTRTEETQRLLALSQGLSSSLEVRSHIEPILDAALAGGASVARLVFSSESGGSAVGFGKGEGNEKYEALDAQMLAMTQAQERVLLSNPARARIHVERGTTLPESVAAFALKDKHEHLGALWLAYDQAQAFAPESVSYLETLAGQASAAAANARLYVTARLGQQRLEGVLMADPQAILLMDSRQNLVFANAEAGRILNFKGDLTQPQPLGHVVTNRAVVDLLRSVSSKPQAAEIEIDKAAYTAMLTPIWSGPDLIGFACTLQDVTRAKSIESARMEFLATVGHDLKDPLKMIGGFLSMLAHHGQLNEQQNVYIRKIEQSLQDISRFAASLLTADRLEQGEGLQLESFALKDLLASVTEEVAPRARQKRVQLTSLPAEGNERLLVADRTLLRSALRNLLDNAVKFSPRAGTVQLSTAYGADSVTVAVRDAGGGIAPVDLPRLFDRPAGLQKAATGLAIVRSIVERHKGKAWAESELGMGSTFYIQIPLQPRSKPRTASNTP
jgi:two-component system NtrC family sensor kinase